MFSKAEIIDMCKDIGVPYAGMTKAQMIQALERELDRLWDLQHNPRKDKIVLVVRKREGYDKK